MADSNAKKLAQLLDANGDVKLSNLDNVQTDVVNDTTPQLGGDLDGNGNTIDLSGSTDAQKTPVGTTAQRSTEAAGAIRFNTTTSLMEYYDGTQWKGLDTAPTVSSISPSSIPDSDSSVDIVITGTGFSSGATVKAIGADASEISAGTVTIDSGTQITANFDGTSFDDAQEDYDIKVTASSGLAGTLDDCLAVNATPAFDVASGSLGTIYDSARSGSYSVTSPTATDADADSLTYSISVGSLPSGMSINSSTAAITGTPDAVGSDTTSTFTVSVTDGTNTNTRQYSITIKAPAVTTYTSSSGTFSVPTGTTAVDVLVVAGGGGGGSTYINPQGGGGGGAGGLIYRPAFPVTPGGTVSYSIGGGGSPANAGEGSPGGGGSSAAGGGQSTFGTLTAQGGGGGANSDDTPGSPGGSGGGGSSGGAANPGGNGTQPQQPGDSGTYGFGNNGGGSPPGNNAAGGGGGAGQYGTDGSGDTGGPGGVGKVYSISGSPAYYAGGGGGAPKNHHPSNPSGGQGGGGAARWDTNGNSGDANRGGGGGGTAQASNVGGSGGSGVVIVKY